MYVAGLTVSAPPGVSMLCRCRCGAGCTGRRCRWGGGGTELGVLDTVVGLRPRRQPPVVPTRSWTAAIGCTGCHRRRVCGRRLDHDLTQPLSPPRNPNKNRESRNLHHEHRDRLQDVLDDRQHRPSGCDQHRGNQSSNRGHVRRHRYRGLGWTPRPSTDNALTCATPAFSFSVTRVDLFVEGVPMNLNVALLLLVLAGGVGGTVTLQAALNRRGGRCRRTPGALFHRNG